MNPLYPHSHKSDPLDSNNVPTPLQSFIPVVERFVPSDIQGGDFDTLFTWLKSDRSALRELDQKMRNWGLEQQHEFIDWSDRRDFSQEMLRFSTLMTLVEWLQVPTAAKTLSPDESVIDILHAFNRQTNQDPINRFQYIRHLLYLGQIAKSALDMIRPFLRHEDCLLRAWAHVFVAEFEGDVGLHKDCVIEIVQRHANEKTVQDPQFQFINDQYEKDLTDALARIQSSRVEKLIHEFGYAEYWGHASRIEQLIEIIPRERISEQIDKYLGGSVFLGRCDVATVLLKAGADPNFVVRNVMQQGPVLHIAASNRHCGEIIPSLIEFGAKVDAVDFRGRTPAQVAKECQNLEFLPMLELKGK